MKGTLPSLSTITITVFGQDPIDIIADASETTLNLGD